MTTIFTSDPHGTGDAWINKVNQMRRKYPHAQIVFGGDYIDGRPDSAQVLNYVQHCCYHDAVALCGNHEDLLMTFFDDRRDRFGWHENGGNTTTESLLHHIPATALQEWSELTSYRLYDGTLLPVWLHSLPTVHVNEDGVFVHAFLNTQYDQLETAIQQTSVYDRIWRRNFAMSDFPNKTGHTVVFGHTPTTFRERSASRVYGSDDGDNCPIVEFQSDTDAPLIAVDGGCHDMQDNHTGNVVVLEHGHVIDWLT